jgi:hypothetical protein
MMTTVAILDVDWMDDTTFASCSTDQTICLCKVGSSKALRKWRGHDVRTNLNIVLVINLILNDCVLYFRMKSMLYDGTLLENGLLRAQMT